MGLHGSKHPQQAQIVMLGLDGSGKSSLLYKLKYNESVITVPTVGFNVEMLETEARGPGLTVWAVEGQQRMRPHWTHHYPGTDALVFVVDSWDRRCLEEAKKKLHQVVRSGSLKSIPLVVMENKQDLPGAASPQEITHRLDLFKWENLHNWSSLKQTEVDKKNTVKQRKPKSITILTKTQGLGCS